MNTQQSGQGFKKTTPTGFRLRLQLTMMLVVSVATALALYFAQRNVQTAYGQRMKDEFQSRLGFHLGEREARQSAVSERCRQLAKSVRIRAALEEDDVEDLYLNATVELRDVLAGENTQSLRPSAMPRAIFFRFLNAGGRVLMPPGETPQSWEEQLNAAGMGQGSQQVGYVVIRSAEGENQLAEVVTTPILEPDGKMPGGLVLGFPPIDFTSKQSGGDMKNGILLGGRLYMAGMREPELTVLSREIAAAIGSSGQSGDNSMLNIRGEPHLLFFKNINPGSRYATAYQVSFYPLAASLAEQKKLRWEIIDAALLLLLCGLAASHFFSASLSKPVEELVVDSEQNLARREEAEAALVLTEQKYRSIFENAVEGIYLLKPDGGYLSANPSLARIYGYDSPAELVAELSAPVRSLYADPVAGCELLDRAAKEDVLSNFEAEIFCRDGRRIWVSQNIRAVRDVAGALIHFEGTLEDITERKNSADALREVNGELEKALAELKATQKQIIQQERLRALGQMASGIAHDFNNALTPIIGFADLMVGMPDVLADSAKTTEYLEVIRTAAKDATRIVARLREFYRVNEVEDVFAPVDLKKLASQVITLTKPKWKDQAQASGAGIQIGLELENVPDIAGNDSDLREVLTNLIFNAVDAMPTGGKITIRTCSEQGRVFVEVADTGTGMSDEVRERCLEPFFSTKGERGTGLGLAMVFGIVKRHNGTVAIESKPGEGAKFILGFPVNTAVIASTVVVQNQKASQRALNILLVDDEAQVRRVLTALLNADAHNVETANDGVQGLSQFAGGNFDLVITDRAMPGMNGDQLAVAIKQFSPNTPVVLLSGFVSAIGSGKIPGVDVVAGKPIQLPSLREAINKAMKAA